MRFLLHIKILRLCKESETLDLYPVLKETMEIEKVDLELQYATTKQIGSETMKSLSDIIVRRALREARLWAQVQQRKLLVVYMFSHT